jgi:hypothetical protein
VKDGLPALSGESEEQKTLVGRAQWKINQPLIPEEVTSELGRII